MKIPVKKSICIFFFGIVLLGSYSYVWHKEYHTPSSTLTQINEQIDEKTYQLPDIQVLKLILGLVQKLIP